MSIQRLRHPDAVLSVLRTFVSKAGTFIGGLGIFLVAGAIIGASATWVFGELAETVMAGKTQAFDEAVLRWMGAHHTRLLDAAMLGCALRFLVERARPAARMRFFASLSWLPQILGLMVLTRE